MQPSRNRVGRRAFLAGTAATAVATIVPRHVLGGPEHVAPSDTITAGLVGCGGQGGEDLTSYVTKVGGNFRLLARCDVKYVGRADNRTIYTDFRRVVERKDIRAKPDRLQRRSFVVQRSHVGGLDLRGRAFRFFHQEIDDLALGMQFQVDSEDGPLVITVIEIADDEVTVDGNHPLAGVPLNFAVTVREVREATLDEIEHGHVHGPSAHEH